MTFTRPGNSTKTLVTKPTRRAVPGVKTLFLLVLVSLVVLAPVVVSSSSVVLARNTDWSRDPIYGSRFSYTRTFGPGYYLPVGLRSNVSFKRASNSSLRYEAVNRTRTFNDSVTNTTVDASKIVRANSSRFSYRSGLRRNVTVGFRSNWRLQDAIPGTTSTAQASSYSNTGVVYTTRYNSGRYRAEQRMNTYQQSLEKLRVMRRSYSIQKKKDYIQSVNNTDSCGYCT